MNRVPTCLASGAAVIPVTPVSLATAPGWVLAASEALEVAAAFGGAAAVGTALVTLVSGAAVPMKLLEEAKTACRVVALPQ